MAFRLPRLFHIPHLGGRLLTAFPSSHYALLSLFFFTGLEVIFGLRQWITALIVVVFLILLVGIIFVRMEEGGAFHPTQTILPALSAIGLTGFALFLPTVSFLHLYFIGSSLLFFYILKYGAKQAYPTWNWIISLAVLFVNIATILGWRFHLYIPVIFVVGLVFAIFFLVSVQSLQRLSSSTSEALLLSLSIAFVLTEIAWACQFLPLNYVVQTGILTAMYYVIFHLIGLHFERGLNKQDIVEYMTIGGIALLVVLLSARWV